MSEQLDFTAKCLCLVRKCGDVPEVRNIICFAPKIFHPAIDFVDVVSVLLKNSIFYEQHGLIQICTYSGK